MTRYQTKSWYRVVENTDGIKGRAALKTLEACFKFRLLALQAVFENVFQIFKNPKVETVFKLFSG